MKKTKKVTKKRSNPQKNKKLLNNRYIVKISTYNDGVMIIYASNSKLAREKAEENIEKTMPGWFESGSEEINSVRKVADSPFFLHCCDEPIYESTFDEYCSKHKSKRKNYGRN